MIDTNKAKNTHKSFTVMAGAVVTLLTNFFLLHPTYIDTVLKGFVSPNLLSITHDAVIYFISAGGFTAIWLGRVRKSEDLATR